MIKKLLILLSTLICLLITGCENVPESWINDLEDQILEDINSVRADSSLSPLTLHNELTDFSRDHSRDMGTRNFFSHDTPDGKTYNDRIAESGIAYSIACENIYMRRGNVDYVTVEELSTGVVSGWLNSDQGHRENMLRENCTHGGVGCYEENDSLYVTFNAIAE